MMRTAASVAAIIVVGTIALLLFAAGFIYVWPNTECETGHWNHAYTGYQVRDGARLTCWKGEVINAEPLR